MAQQMSKRFAPVATNRHTRSFYFPFPLSSPSLSFPIHAFFVPAAAYLSFITVIVVVISSGVLHVPQC